MILEPLMKPLSKRLPMRCMLLTAVFWMMVLPIGPSHSVAGEMALPPGLVADAPPERFSPQTLFEIINGDADLYLKSGFVDLETRRFSLEGDSGQWIDFFAYRMRGHRSAFAVYSVRRSPEAVPDDLTPFAYRYQDGLFFVHGPYYVEIRGADDANPLAKAISQLAVAFIAGTRVEAVSIPELTWFPKEGLMANSVALHPAGAFGFKAFDNLFTAGYRMGGNTATAFFRGCASTGAAEQLATAFKNFLVEFDGAVVPVKTSLENAVLVRTMDTYTLVFTQGRTVAGVRDAATPEDAATLAEHLRNGLASGR